MKTQKSTRPKATSKPINSADESVRDTCNYSEIAVREGLAKVKPLTLDKKDYLVLAQFSHRLYKLMIENPYDDPLELANVMMDDMFAEFLEASGELPDSSISSNN